MSRWMDHGVSNELQQMNGSCEYDDEEYDDEEYDEYEYDGLDMVGVSYHLRRRRHHRQH